MEATQNHHLNGFGGHGDEEIEGAGGHPLLTSWNPPTEHSFSKIQMTTLTSLCDAFSPSIDYPGADSAEEVNLHDSDTKSSQQTENSAGSRKSFKGARDMSAFYGCSASDMGIPEDIAGLLSVLLKPKLLVAIRVFLWLLSTRLGTVILGGRASLIWQFPFCQSFSNLPRSNQETILRRWSLSMFASLRAVYKLFKMITMWAVYTKIEKNGHNRNWKAIGYCGADPQVIRDRKSSSGCNCAPRDVLKDIVIETQAAGKSLVKVLDRAGVAVLDDISPLKKLATTKTKRTTAIPSRLENSAQNEVGISCDIVVVGSGSGGGVAASVLAKAGYKVIVLEKGKYFTTEDLSTLEGPSQMAMFEKLGSLATEDGGVNLVAGATVGGGSAINWSACFETPLNVRQEWKEITGLDLFTSTQYQLAMREVWCRLGVQTHVTRENLPNSVLRAGCEKLGDEVGTLARNTPPDHDCGWCTSGCPRSQKGSTAATWLVDAAESGNAVIMSECEAETILYSPNDKAGKKQYKARGVVAKVGTSGCKVYIEAQAVVVASGSLMTPPLLLNSGLHNPNIGKGLHLHPVVFIWGYFPEECGPSGTCYEGAIMTSYSRIYKKNSGAPAALLEVPSTHPGSFASFQPWTSAADFKERMARFSRTVTLCVVTRDESTGQVSVEPDGTPVITYTLNAADEQTALEGIEKGLRVLIAAGATEIGTHQQDGERFRVKDANPNDIEAYLKRVRARGVKKNQISMGSGHHMSSCKMGSDPKHSVVDGEGESWEVEGLYLSDGSVLPNAVGVNPMVTIQSLAYCTAHSVLQSLQSQYKTSSTKRQSFD
ncbi:hypothetical protein M758_2G219900 [Ceratodon purpureus]|nr:hypothetical protein M758_2G219900 [Ceratodon purpureus]